MVRTWLGTWRRLGGDMLRVLAAHWPQFLGLFLIGAIGRMGFLWLAVWASRFHGLLGVLILPLAPLCTLFSLLLMLRLGAESLPAFRHVPVPPSAGDRWREHLRAVSQMMLPFIALYTTEGLVFQDSRMYVQDIVADDMSNSIYLNPERFNYAQGWWLLALIAAALGLRKLIVLRELATRSVAVSLVATYLEALWMMALVRGLITQLKEMAAWLRSRVFFDSLAQQWEYFLAWIGPARPFLLDCFNALGVLSSGVTSLVMQPLTWLAIGAACYEADLQRRDARFDGTRLGRRLTALPAGARKVALEAVEPVAMPLKYFVAAVSRVVTAGMASLVLFCVSFLLVGQAQVGAAWLLRVLVGPRDSKTHVTLLPYLDQGAQLVYFILAVGLLLAALNLILGGRPMPAVASGQRGEISVPGASQVKREQQVFGSAPPQHEAFWRDPRRQG